MLKAFDGHKRRVNMIRLGVSKFQGYLQIASWSGTGGDGKPYKAARGVAYEGADIYDWVYERDFFPGVPLSGRVVGKKAQGQLVPLKVPAGEIQIPVRAQYLEDWGHVTKWASLKRNLNKFRFEALTLWIVLWQQIERARSRCFKVRDLSSIIQKILSDFSGPLSSLLEQPCKEVLEAYRDGVNRRLRGTWG